MEKQHFLLFAQFPIATAAPHALRQAETGLVVQFLVCQDIHFISDLFLCVMVFSPFLIRGNIVSIALMFLMRKINGKCQWFLLQTPAVFL